MAFKKKTWKDRLVEFAGRRQITRVSGAPNGTMVVDVTRAEGTVSQAGDAFSAANMNDLEQRSANEFGEINGNFEALGERESESVSMIDDGANLGTAIWQSVCYITLPPGKWLIFGQANLINRNSDQNATLYQKIIVETGINTYKDVMADALGVIQRNNQTIGLVDLDARRSVYLQVYSNVAGSYIYSKAISAVRIG